MSHRAAAILQQFKLTQTATGWEATWLRPDGTVFSSYTDADKARLCRTVRCQWGHFNYQDEAEAFAKVFN